VAPDDGPTPWTGQAERLTLAIAVIAGATTGLAQAVFGPLVLVLVPTFAPAVRIFDILALTIFLLPVATIPSLVLDSARVNRPGRHLGIWIVALVVNCAANGLVLAMGKGPVALAINDVWVQLLVVVVLFEASARHIWDEGSRRRLKLYGGLTLAFSLAVILTTILDLSVSHQAAKHLDFGFLLLRCATTLIVWTALGFVLIRPAVSPLNRVRRGR